ncbi:MAG TPA: hypothetical protein VFT71_07950 [Candidatus Nitrosocosmicus sp.]|jgi:hypothetical protein|nr:hypothetical protein [Candidatus Nitrosocosmicus sp.]
MQYFGRLSIVVAFSFILSSGVIAATAIGQSNDTQPVISEIEIPEIFHMEFDKNSSANTMNISYTLGEDEKYLFINISKVSVQELDPDNNCIEVNQNETGEILYSCFSENNPGTTSVFCNDVDDCVQAGSRPR